MRSSAKGASNNGEMAKTSHHTQTAVARLRGISWAFLFYCAGKGYRNRSVCQSCNCHVVFYSDRSASTCHSVELATQQPPAKLENTHQLGPHRTFPTEALRLIIEETLEKYLKHEQYDSHLCGLMSKLLSEVWFNVFLKCRHVIVDFLYLH